MPSNSQVAARCFSTKEWKKMSLGNEEAQAHWYFLATTKEQRVGLSNKVLNLKYYLDNHSTMMYNPTTR